MSRFRTFAALTALVVLTAAFAACGGGSSDDPQQIIDDATLEGVESGKLDLSLTIEGKGERTGDLDVGVSGAFQRSESGDLPEMGMTATADGTARGEKVDFDGGLTILRDRAFVNYEGTEYEVDPTTFGFLKTSFEQAQNQGAEGNAADLGACQEAAEGMRFADFIENLRDDGSVDVDGTETTKVSGDLDTESALDAVIELAEDPACSTQLEAAGGPLPVEELDEARSELTGAVKRAHVEVFVGEDDIVRRVAAELTVEPEDAKGEEVAVELELTLSGVNEEQQISAPAGGKPLQDLFLKLGVNPIELLESASTGEGLGELIEELTDGLFFGGGSSAGSDGASGGSGGGRQAYVECLKDVRTTADLQRCAGMIQ